MSGFGKLLKKGQRRHGIKSTRGQWGRCEECDERAILHPYRDVENQTWMMCEKCIELYVNEGEE